MASPELLEARLGSRWPEYPQPGRTPRPAPHAKQARLGVHGEDSGAAEALRLCKADDAEDAEWRQEAAAEED